MISVQCPEADRLLPRTVTEGGPGDGGMGGCRKQAQHQPTSQKSKEKTRVCGAGEDQSKSLSQEWLNPEPQKERDLPYLAPRLNARSSRHGECLRLLRVGSGVESEGEHGSGQIHPSGLFQGLSDTEISYYMLYSAFIQSYPIMS